MFDWSTASVAVEEGSLSPLAVVPELELLGDLDLLSLDATAALAVVELMQAATSSLSAISALAIEALTRREVEQVARERDDRLRRSERGWMGPTGEDLAVASLAPVLHLTPRTMGTRLDEVRTLVNHLPRTFAMVRAGRLDLYRAGSVAAEALLVQPEHRAAFDEEITAAPTGRRRVPLVDLTSGGIHKRAAGVAVRVDPESAAARAEAALKDRFVRVTPGTDPGVSTWSASLPSDGSLKAWAAVDALASQYATADPGRRIDQARADALLDLILGQATIRTTVELVVPVDPSLLPELGRPIVVNPGLDLDLDLDLDDHLLSPWERRLHLVVVHGVEIEPWTHLPDHQLSDRADPEADVGDLLLHDPPTEEDRDDGWTVTPALEGGEGVDALHALARADCGRPSSPLPEHSSLETPGIAGRAGPRHEDSPLPTCEVGVRHPRVGILLNAAVTAWLADPDTRIRLHGCDLRTGALVVHDPSVYRPNQRLARIIRARDGHCRFPGCGTDAPRCQLDHVVRFPEGLTTLDNLVCLCSRHHAFKHSSGWTLTMDPDGTCTWTSPLGRTHVTKPRTMADLAA